MKFNREHIIKELNLRRFGQKQWLSSKELTCPFCGKGDKFGILLTENKALTHCFYGCQGESLASYFKKIGRRDLLQFEEDIDLRKVLRENILESEEELVLEMEEKRLPMGYKRIYDHPYLNSRDFTKEQYELFEVGMTKIDPRFKNDYIIFPLRNSAENCVGYIVRSLKTKQWHDENLKLSKEGKCSLVLRYDNSLDTDFSKYLYGENEITENTEVVILVEGIFSKFAVDRKLDLYSDDYMKCCATFGQNVSQYQILKLLNKGVERIILLYDNDTINSTKTISLNLTNYFKTEIGYIAQKGKDPDDLTQEELLDVMMDLRAPLKFFTGKISNRLRLSI